MTLGLIRAFSMTTVNSMGEPTGRDGHSRGHLRDPSSGMAWLLAAGLLGKVVTFAGQIVLANLISAADFGLASMAFTAAALSGTLLYLGTREVLIQRGSEYDQWVTATFWMSSGVAVLATCLGLLSAPIAQHYYSKPIGGLVVSLSLAYLVFPLVSVAEARLQVSMRFRLLALASLVTAVGSVAIGVALAWISSGPDMAWLAPYAVVLPFVLMNIIRGFWLWIEARPQISRDPDFKKWPELATNSTLILGASLFYILAAQVDRVILGRYFREQVVGLYFWAYSIAMQSAALISGNAATVLLPALSLMHADEARGRAAFLRAAHGLVVVAVFGAVVQIITAAPFVHLVFKEEYHQGIPLLVVFSAGSVFHMLQQPATAMLRSQGRYRASMISYAASAGTFLLGSALVAMLANDATAALYMSLAVSACSAVSTAMVLATVLRGKRGTLVAIVRLHSTPLVAGACAALAGLLARELVPSRAGGWLIAQILLSVTAWASVFLILLGVFDRSTVVDIGQRLRRALLGLRPARNNQRAQRDNGDG